MSSYRVYSPTPRYAFPRSVKVYTYYRYTRGWYHNGQYTLKLESQAWYATVKPHYKL